MEYTHLGKTGLEVSRLCLGSMTFGSWGIGAEDARLVIDRAVEAGINFIDTADLYGTSEEVVGQALKGKRDRIVLATKFAIRTEEGPNGAGASRHRIMRQVENSLRNLQTDYIDLYQIHRPDAATPIEETMRALDDLVRQGKVRYIGCSNFESWQIVESLWASDRMNLERLASNQPSYSLLDRHIEREILPVSHKYGLATLCYSPLHGGWLSGKYSGVDKAPAGSRGAEWDLQAEDNRLKAQAVGRLQAIADRRGVSLAQLALGWLLHQGPAVIPILGVKSLAQLEDNLGAINVALSKAELAEIDTSCPLS
ncbi:aldo/keto reductase [Cohnella sp. GCM10020058]|uniref:aldo/keto reductase n=1 Tax=Cohnella sp. GCM10020058 TaxID=3317330 RepID=UPI00362DEA1F